MRAVSSLLFLSIVAFAACGGGASEPAKPHTSVLSTIASTPASVSAKPAPPPKEPPRTDPSLMARHLLFANPDRALPLLSPDGKRLSYLSNVEGVLNVWVAPATTLDAAKAVTRDAKRGIRQYHWAFTNNHILYLVDEGGDENWHIHLVDVTTQSDKDLTPLAGVQARIAKISHKQPKTIVVGLNDRDKRYHDLYKIDLGSGQKTLLQKNEGFASFDIDDDLVVRFASKPEKDGSIDVQTPDGKGGFASAFRIPHEDSLTTQLGGFDKSGKKAFLVDSRGRNTAALVELDLATKETKVLFEDPRADVRDIIQHPTERRVQAGLSSFDRLSWNVLDPTLTADLAVIQAAAPGDIQLMSRTLDDSKWLVAQIVSDGPVRYYAYERAKKKVDFLFSNVKAFESAKLAKMHPVILKSRDGLDLVSYLTLPRARNPNGDARPDKPLPMVLFVHGGPWSRDEWSLNRWHQWLADRGYAVLSVNFRGSTGFGKKFVNAADKEWAGKTHEDLLDAVHWAVEQKIAQKDKVAIMGGSYGGYATLVGLTFTPETFACGVDIVGPSNLVTLLGSIPPYWESEIEQFTKRIGDHRTEDGRKFLLSRSPLSRVEKITRPLLIGQGANDPRVKQAESDQIVKAMQARSIPVTYVVYPDEGHGFARPENKTSFNSVAEIFLAQCLGGPYEPIGEDFKGSSITVPAGKEQVYSLDGAVR